MPNNIPNINQILSKLNIKLNNDISRKLNAYYEMINIANSYMNLTSIIDINEVFIKHFADSLSLLRQSELLHLNSNISIIDVGTGAGFPGIPLKIALNNISIVLVDSTGKKVDFINDCIKKLDLKNAKAIKARAEELSIITSNFRDNFDICISRAVARLPILCELCLPFVKKGGFMVAYKSRLAKDEIKECEKAISNLSSKLYKIDNFYLPLSNDIRNNILIKKINKTNPKYPRSYSKIKNSPL